MVEYFLSITVHYAPGTKRQTRQPNALPSAQIELFSNPNSQNFPETLLHDAVSCGLWYIVESLNNATISKAHFLLQQHNDTRLNEGVQKRWHIAGREGC